MVYEHIDYFVFIFFFQAEDGIRDKLVTGVQTCALPISLQGPKKLRHIMLGVLLNIIGLATLIVIDGPTAFMNTPAKFAEGGMDLRTFIETTATLWDKMNNYSWWPLNLHRTVGNVVFGGFITRLIGAYLYLAAKNDEEDR